MGRKGNIEASMLIFCDVWLLQTSQLAWYALSGYAMWCLLGVDVSEETEGAGLGARGPQA